MPTDADRLAVLDTIDREVAAMAQGDMNAFGGVLAADGSLGYHTYEYGWRVTPRGGGAPSVGHGKGMHVLRRQADGPWKILREVWNASPAS